MAITVGYYLAPVSLGMAAGGVAPYAKRILNILLSEDRGVRFHLLVHPSQVEDAQRYCEATPNLCVGYSIVRPLKMLHRINRLAGGHAIARSNKLFAAISRASNPLLWQGINGQVDLVHSPVQDLPAFNNSKPCVVTMHDVQELHYPEFFSPHERLARAQNHWWALEGAAAVVVSYPHVKQDLVQFFGLSPDKVKVCPIPIEKNWFDVEKAEMNAPEVRARYSLPDTFMLYPAATWQHKNHLGLLRAMHHLIYEENISLPALICTGHQSPYFEVIQREIDHLKLHHHVRFLGVVPSEDLASLYRLCQFVVVPTLYEGGSFPVMEAMLAGAPVICSRVTSLPETIGDLQFTFDSSDVIDTARAVKLASIDRDYRTHSVQNGRIQMAKLSNSVAPTLDAFHEMYARTVGAS